MVVTSESLWHGHLDTLHKTDAHIMTAKALCPLKISKVVEDDQCLLMHTPSGMELPNNFLGIRIQKMAKF